MHMTEAEWMACCEPQPMLKFLRGWMSERKLRLFACACCRQLWHRLREEPDRKVVEVVERFCDRKASGAELAAAREAALQSAMWGSGDNCPGPLWLAGWFGTEEMGAWANAPDPNAPAVLAWASTLERAEDIPGLLLPWATALGLEPAIQAALFRDVMHAPYRVVSVRAQWKIWNKGCVVNLAHSLYEERAFERLPILGDALEDAGCIDPDMLLHLRGTGPHVPGCWVLDALLGNA
jgi:hypothetical protein